MQGKVFSVRNIFLVAKLHLSKHDALKILGVEPGAKKREVRAAYLAKVNLTHPDKGGDPEKFKKVQAAYDLLRKNRFQTVIQEWKPKWKPRSPNHGHRRHQDFHRTNTHHQHFQEQRIPLSQIILHMKKFAHDLILHMKSRNKSKPKTEEEKLERLTNRILTGVVIAPIFFGIAILIMAKAKKRTNTTADQSEFDFEVSVERRPETFLVLVVTALNEIRERHKYTFSNSQLFLDYSNHILKGNRIIFLDDADLLYLSLLFPNQSDVQELLELLKYVPGVLDELNSRKK